MTGSRLYDPYFGEWNCIECGYVTYVDPAETERKRIELLVRHSVRDDLDPLVIIPTASKHQHIGTARCPWCWQAFGVDRWMKASSGKRYPGSAPRLATWKCSQGHYISLIEKVQTKHRDGEWVWE